MKYVLFVHFDQPAHVLLPRAQAELGLHISRMRDFHAQGTLLMSGAFRTPAEPLSTMGVFRTREAAEAFAHGDPFILQGMARGWQIREWQEIVPEPDPDSPGAQLAVKHVLLFATAYASIEEAYAQAPGEIARHVARSQEFQAMGSLLMAGAFAGADQLLETMAIVTSRQAAEEYAAGDPFVLNGMVTSWHIREWNDVVAQPPEPA